MARRRFMRIVVLGAVALVAAVGLSTYVAAIRPARKFIDDAHRLGLRTADAVAVVVEGERDLGAARPRDARLWTATREVRDVAAVAGRTVVLTSGGAVLSSRGSRGGARLLTTLDGLGDVDLRVAAPFGDGVALGGADGRITLLGPERVRILRVGQARGPVQELVASGGLLFAAWLGGGAVALEPAGGRAVALDAEPGKGRRADLGSVSALAVDRSRYALGTTAGHVHVGDGRGLRQVCTAVPGGRVMALAFDGDALLVGTPLGLFQADGRGACTQLRGDLLVTALRGDGPLLHVATFDDGVHVLDRSGGAVRQAAHLLPRTRVDHLRALGGDLAGTLAAVGPGGAHALTSTAARPLDLPRAGDGDGRLHGGHVTALLRGPAGRLWVGTFEHGITLLGPGGDVVGHLPRQPEATARQVNALALLPDTGEVAVATVRGIVLVGEAGERRLTPQEGLVGNEVSAVAVARDGALLAATNRGLTVLHRAGGRDAARTIGAFHGLGNNHSYAVAESGRTLFVGTLGGLALVRDLKVEKTLAAGRGPLRHSWVTALVPAREAGAVWVGTNGGGVARVTEDGTVESVAPDEPGFHVNPGALALDPVSGALVAGTLERGALLIDPRTRTVRPIRVPLPSLFVSAVLVDADYLYLGTDRGLLRVPRAAAGLGSQP
jgi:ligand-binding sensor domain-containing protein